MSQADAERPVRYDKFNRLLCHAKRRDGGYCRQPARRGQKVCKMHGGNHPDALKAARRRLAQEVDPSITTLVTERDQADASRDRQSAANSLLDRAGISRTSSVEVGDARAILLERLQAMVDGDDS